MIVRVLRQATSRLFGERAAPVDVTAIKSMTGHNSGASGLVSLVSALGAMKDGFGVRSLQEYAVDRAGRL